MVAYSRRQQNPQIYVLDASAGTGKTYNLAKQYIKLLFSSHLEEKKLIPKNILAITFTNKAAIEMKQRILELLKRIALNFWDDKENIKHDILNYLLPAGENVNVDPATVAKDIINNILEEYHYFQVQTIDSFVYTIASLYAFQLGLSPNFKIETKHDQYLQYCLEYLIDTATKNKQLKNLFETFIDSYLKLENKKSFYPKRDIFEVVKSLYEQTTYHGNKFKKSGTTSELEKIRVQLGRLIQDFYNSIPKEKFQEKFISALEKLVNKYNTGNYLITINDISSSKYFTKDELPLKKNCVINEKIHKQWKEIRKLISKFYDFYCSSVYNPYIDIFNCVEKVLHKTTLEQDLVFLSELNKRIQKIITSKDYSVPELYMRMATTIQHCLVDEFQDTSILQWRNLNPIISEILATGGTLFYVGDKKQAIYRYRGGDYRLFDMIPDYYSRFKLQWDTLNVNYRSEKFIVEFNNKIFSQENLQNFINIIEKKEEVNFDTKAKETLLKVYKNSQQKYENKDSCGYVFGELLQNENSEDLQDIIKQKVLSVIDKLVQNGYKLSQIGILVRKNPQGELVSNWLLEKGYPVESDKTLDVQKNNFVKELISLLKFLISDDELFFVSFILGRIFIESSNLPLDEIISFVFNSRKNKTDKLQLLFKTKYPQLWDKFFEPLLKVTDTLPVSDILIKIYKIFNFKDLTVFKENYPFFYKLVDIATELEDENCSLQYFVEQFELLPEEKRYITAKGEDSIHVMTIHKAKGLEFDIVILPFVNIEINIGKQKDTSARFVSVINNNILENEPSELDSYLVKLTKTSAQYSEKLLKLYTAEYIKTLTDELNVLYVAFTRAKKQLYFFAQKDKYTEFLFPWDGNFITYGQFEPLTQQVEEKTQNIVLQHPVEHTSWYEKLVEQRIQKKQVLFREQILKGEIIHKILSFVDNLYGQNVQDKIYSAVEKTKSVFNPNLEVCWDEYKNFVTNLVNKEELKKFFFVKEGTIFCEQEIVTSYGETKRPDRIIIQDDKVIVVDYKLAFSEDEVDNYKQQVLEYKNLLYELYNKPVDGYIIFLDTSKLLKI